MLIGNFVRTTFKKFQSLTPDPDTIYFLYDSGAIYLGSVCVGNTLRGKSGIVISDSEPNDPDHPVWLDPDGEVGPLDLDITGASVGQVPTVKSVDENGVPTEWEAVELPSGAYIVNLTMGDDGSITADKTFAEIKAASDDGKVVNAKFADAIVPLCSLIDSDAIFAMTNANSDGVFTGRFICTSANVWSMSQNGFDAHTLGISGASVGQIVKIKTVDSSGVPTEWEAVELPSGAYIVNLTMGDDGSITADKTFAEIKAASDDGKVVNAKFADAIVPLCSLIDSDAIFAMTNANSGGVFTADLTCTSANVWSMSQDGFDAHTLGISGASVGQTVKIKTVDASGKPTAWEATDMASGGDWEFINEISTNEWISSVTINQDSNGNPFSLKKMRIFMTLPKTTNEAGEEQTNAGYAYYAVNGMRPAWQIPSNGWTNALFLWTIEALGDYYTVTCFKDGENGAQLWHSDIFKSEGAFSTINKFEWRLFNGTYGWNNTNFKVYGVRA